MNKVYTNVVIPLAELYEVEPEAIMQGSKRLQVSKARHCIMWFLWSQKGYKQREIATYFNCHIRAVRYGIGAYELEWGLNTNRAHSVMTAKERERRKRK